MNCPGNTLYWIPETVHATTTIPDIPICSPFKALEKRLLGGVTLNHLCWAAVGGVPTGLLALQGEDDLGRLIRSSLQSLDVSTQFIASERS